MLRGHYMVCLIFQCSIPERPHSQSSASLTRLQCYLAVITSFGASHSSSDEAPALIKSARILSPDLPQPTFLHARGSCVKCVLLSSMTSLLLNCHVRHLYTFYSTAGVHLRQTISTAKAVQSLSDRSKTWLQ